MLWQGLRSLDPRLPRTVWTMEVGGFLNAFGNGIVFPFLLIYLHNVRGIGLGTAGLVLATNNAAGLVSTPLAGSLVDRIGGRATLSGALVVQAAGFASFSFVHRPWTAFLAAAIAGVGDGGFWPSQSTLLAGLTPPPRRHAAYALQRVTRNFGIGIGGVLGGLIAITSQPTTFTVLFSIDAVTFLAFAVVLIFVPEPELDVEPDAVRGRYIDVLRDRVFLGVVGLNVLFVTGGYAMLELMPVFAKNEAGISERAIGLIFFLNTIAIVLAQLPLVKLLEGRRRMLGLALMTVIWAVALLLIGAAGAWLRGGAAVALLCLAAVVFGLGECFHGPTQGALVADLAPPRLRGRYMALSTSSWGLGFVIGPAVGGAVLGAAPLALWPAAAALCLVAGVGSLALERRLPRELRLTPA